MIGKKKKLFQNNYIYSLWLSNTVKLLLSDQLRDHQMAVAKEKRSSNATKMHHTKQSDNIYYALTTHYFQQNPMLLVLI